MYVLDGNSVFGTDVLVELCRIVDGFKVIHVKIGAVKFGGGKAKEKVWRPFRMETGYKRKYAQSDLKTKGFKRDIIIS